MIWPALAVIGATFLAANLLYLVWYVRWLEQRTAGVGYFARSLAERRAFKQRVRRLAIPALPLVRLLAATGRSRATMPTFVYDGVPGPPKVSSPQIFAQAKGYRPTPADVFVVTQMRCGTTWMQQIVYEVVTRGKGDLGDQGHRHLNAMSPWIDGAHTVRLQDAPLVGEGRVRIIKSHLPIAICPYDPAAKYIYVTRHPVSCFASIVDFTRTLQGPFMPTVDELAAWFCSDRMYWSPWPQHVEGWWRHATEHRNVLFVHFEDMKENFGDVLDRVAAFLGYRLTTAEQITVTEKSSFRYMADHEELFEMAPPTMFSVSAGKFLSSGQASRHQDVSPALRERILEYCRRSLAGSAYAVQTPYRELKTHSSD